MTAFIAVLAAVVGIAIAWGAVVLYRQDQRIDDLRAQVVDTQRQLTVAIQLLTELNAGTPLTATAATKIETIGQRAKRRNQRAS